ncbi:hypothetical protein ACFVUS_27155 [Nocardia sp. NPDC058058]|uniref:hypothetical protein n=1 Tax=Nocardia sp. NPDC058058 TaxID=3346317 RepID=UPI0036DB1F14
MTQPVNNARVDSVVNSLKRMRERGIFGAHFTADEARASLNSLLCLTSAEFVEAWNRLDTNFWYETYLSTLGKDARSHRIEDPQFKDLLYAIEHHDMDRYYRAKKEQETSTSPELARQTGPDPDLRKFTHPEFGFTGLIPPAGCSAEMKAMVDDVSNTMLFDLNTLGTCKPNEVPPKFAPDLWATTTNGDSIFLGKIDEFEKYSREKKNSYLSTHSDMGNATSNSAIIHSTLFIKLIDLSRKLQEVLSTKLTDGLMREGLDKWVKVTENKDNPHIKPNGGLVPDGDGEWVRSTITEEGPTHIKRETIFEKKEDGFHLVPQVELEVYYKPMTEIVKQWAALYDEATTKLLHEAKPPGNGGTTTGNSGTTGTTTGNSGTTGTTTGNSGTTGTTTGVQTNYEDLINQALGGSLGDGNMGGTTTADNNAAKPGSDGAIPPPQGMNNTPANGNGYDPMTQMAMQQAMGNLGNRNRVDGGDQIGERRSSPRREPNTVTPVSNAQTPAAATTTGSPTSPQLANGLKSITIPGLDGTLKVSPVVSNAVEWQMRHPEGSDARAAYEGTPGQSTPSTPWQQLPPGEGNAPPKELRTGDVVQWADHSALVVMKDNDPYIILDGRPIRFDPAHPENLPPDLIAAFPKIDYFHPSGVDMITSGQAATAPKTTDSHANTQQPGTAESVPTVPPATVTTTPATEI